jgi:uncharacterized protein YjiK
MTPLDKWSRLAAVRAIGVLTVAVLVMLARAPGAPDHRVTGAVSARERLLASYERVTVEGVREPSGVAFDPGRGRLFVVGDEGSLVEATLAGKRVRSFPLGGDLEDVAMVSAGGSVLLLSERKSELLLFDPDAPSGERGEKKRWKLPRAILLGVQPGESNSGFEGLTFKEEPGHPGRGTVFLTHQRHPSMVVALDFDQSKDPGSLGAEALRGRWHLAGAQDLAAITYVPSLDRFLVIAEKKDRLLVVGPEGRLEEEIPLPGRRQEGLCVDGNGDLWVADDEGGMLLRFPSARKALEDHLRNQG